MLSPPRPLLQQPFLPAPSTLPSEEVPRSVFIMNLVRMRSATFVRQLLKFFYRESESTKSTNQRTEGLRGAPLQPLREVLSSSDDAVDTLWLNEAFCPRILVLFGCAVFLLPFFRNIVRKDQRATEPQTLLPGWLT